VTAYPRKTIPPRASADVDALLDEADGTTQTVALGLLARCGLRVAEAADVTPADVVDTPIGPFVRVQVGKGSKYRETPVPANLAASMRALADVRDDGWTFLGPHDLRQTWGTLLVERETHQCRRVE
jgi:integrase